MIVLDENIPDDQRNLLRRWKIPAQKLGKDLGQKGMQDNEHVVPLLRGLTRATMFTRDLGFFRRRFCHSRYCIVSLDVPPGEIAGFVRRVLRHPRLSTHSARLGRVIRVRHAGLEILRKDGQTERLKWSARKPK
jgi:hypothetical protein